MIKYHREFFCEKKKTNNISKITIKNPKNLFKKTLKRYIILQKFILERKYE